MLRHLIGFLRGRRYRPPVMIFTPGWRPDCWLADGGGLL
jgi:hypothetical protein